MSFLLDFFLAGPARVKGLLVGAAALAAVASALGGWALWERASAAVARLEAAQARAERDRVLDQLAATSAAAQACSAGVDLAKRVSDRAIAAQAELSAAAKRLTLPARVERTTIEHWLEKPTPAGSDCRDAWREIEQLYRKARAP